MSFRMYMFGCLILIAGVAIGAYLLHAPLQWIGVGVLCLIGAAIISGVKVTRPKDPPSQEQRRAR
jgi:membrane protein implicated in regulation of membrane protease activity